MASEGHRQKHATAAFLRMMRGEMDYQRRGYPGQPLRMATGATWTENGDGTLTVVGQWAEQTGPLFPRTPLGPTMVEWFTTELRQGESMSVREFLERAPSFAADVVHTTGPIPEALVDVVRRL